MFNSSYYVESVLNYCLFFFFNDTATTEIYTLSLHDALPISARVTRGRSWRGSRISSSTCSSRARTASARARSTRRSTRWARSEEHTSELQSRQYLVCRLLLEKKKKITKLSQQ